jgi:hypothetical protein
MFLFNSSKRRNGLNRHKATSTGSFENVFHDRRAISIKYTVPSQSVIAMEEDGATVRM